MPLPVNFEEKVKAAPAVGGAGYPYRISARDLMANFNYLDQWPKNPGQGDIMYYSLNGWSVLNPPSGSGLHVLTHDGAYPSWTPTEEC
jgi:hypothetical protein